MKALFPLVCTAAVLAGPAYADCSYPAAPDKIPDGTTATLEEMVAAQKAVKAYDEAINSYTSCIRLEYEGAMKKEGESLSDDQKKAVERIQIQKHNAAVDADEAIAARFNEQLRLFKAKSDKAKG